MFITAEQLRNLDACWPSVKRFEAEWPNGAKLTKENCIRAFVDLRLDPNWAAKHFLSALALTNYWIVNNVALAECENARNTAWDKYWKIRVSADAEYKKTMTPVKIELNQHKQIRNTASDKYKKITDFAWAEFELARNAAMDEYIRVMALAFYRLLKAEENQRRI